MADYVLANGKRITDEDIELECADYEAGTWKGSLDTIRVGRPPILGERLVTVTVKLPESMVQGIDARSDNRSDFIRKAIAATLQ